MRTLRLAACCLAVAGLARPAFAQIAVDAGVAAGVGCQQGRDDCAGALVGPVAGVSWGDRVDVRFRTVAFGIADRRMEIGDLTIERSNITRRLWLGEALYRFLPGARVRPVLGASMGVRRDRSTVTCSPGPCPALSSAGGASLLADGSTQTHGSLGLLAGVGFRPHDRLGIDAWLGFHDPTRDEGRTFEATVVATVRLWRSRP